MLTTTQFFFTCESETAIMTGTMQEYYKKCNDQILDLVELVRTKLTKLEKKNISPLIVQGVHERDIIGRIETSKISNILEFEWVAQLRFYSRKSGSKDNIISKCMQTI